MVIELIVGARFCAAGGGVVTVPPEFDPLLQATLTMTPTATKTMAIDFTVFPPFDARRQ
jgi:hypothetical protein